MLASDFLDDAPEQKAEDFLSAEDFLGPEPAQKPLLAGVAPQESGGGRGRQGGPTADELKPARRGTLRGAQPYVAEGDATTVDNANAARLLEQPAEGYLDTGTPAERNRAVAHAKRDTFLARSGELKAPPERGLLQRGLDATVRKPLDNSLGGLLLEGAGDAARGTIRAGDTVAGSLHSGVQAALSGAGLGDTAAAGIAGQAGKLARQSAGQFANPQDSDSLTQQVFESAVTNAATVATFGFGSTALLAMGVQSALNDYGESRDQGKTHDDAIGRAAYMGLAEVIGEKFQLPALGKMFAAAAKKASVREMAGVLKDVLVKDQIGEQVTLALQSGYEKVGAQGRRPDMTLDDYLKDAANTAKVTLGQSLLMGGAAVGARAVAGKFQSPAAQIAGAIDSTNFAPRSIPAADLTPTPSAEQMARDRGFLSGTQSPLAAELQKAKAPPPIVPENPVGKALLDAHNVTPVTMPGGDDVMTGLQADIVAQEAAKAAAAAPVTPTVPAEAPTLSAVPDTFDTAEAAQKFATDNGMEGKVQVADVEGRFVLAPVIRQQTVGELRESQQVTQRLATALEGTLDGVSAANVEFVPDSDLEGPGADAARSIRAFIESAFGVPVTFVRGTTVQGVSYGGRVFYDLAQINKGSDPLERTIGVAFHEIDHELGKSKDPQDLQDRADLEAVIRQYLHPDAVANRQAFEQKGRKVQLPANYGFDEIVADLGGGFAMQPEFWGQMHDKDPGLARRVFYRFMQAATKGLAVLRGTNLDPSKWVSDTEKVRDAYSTMLASRAKRGPANTTAPAATPTLSKTQQAERSLFLKDSVEKGTWFHGTADDITKFRQKQAGATFLSQSSNTADEYTKRSAYWHAKQGHDSSTYGENVMPVHVRVTNPFDYEKQAHVDALVKQLGPAGEKLRQDLVHPDDNWETVERPEVQAAIKALGHDGFYVSEEGGKNLGVYDSKQIKSSLGNTGAFGQRAPTASEAAGVGMSAEEAKVAQDGGDIRFSRNEVTFKTYRDGSMLAKGDPEAIRAALPENVKGRVVDGGVLFTHSDAPRAKAALEGSSTAYSRRGAVLKQLPMKDGKYLGAPEKFDTPGKIPTLRKWLKQLAQEGERGRFWYENSSRYILRMTGGDKTEARKFVALLAIYSPQAKVDTNSTFALRAWAQYQAGQPISVKTAVMDQKAQEALANIDKFWSGEKTGNFFTNLLREIDTGVDAQGATIDMWMMRAAYYSNDAPTKTQYAFMENETNRLAQELGWEPQQVQAAIWVAMKARMENKGVKKATEAKSEKKGWMEPRRGGEVRKVLDEQAHRDNWLDHAFKHTPTEEDTSAAKFDFEDGVRRHLGQVSWEARPGRSTGILPGVNDAPYEDQVDFQQDVQRALQGPDGEDLLAQKLGLLVSDDLLAPGVWQGEIAAGMQKPVAMAPVAGKDDEGKTRSEAEKNKLDPAQKSALDAYIRSLGLLLRQEGVSYHRPFFTTAQVRANGVELRVGRPFTPDEAKSLFAALGKGMKKAGIENWEYDPETKTSVGLISSSAGMRVVNYGRLADNRVFHKIVDAAAEALPDELTVDPVRFASDSNYAGEDWTENQHGQGFARAIGAEGRPDLLGWLRDSLAPRVQAVFDDYSARKGWGDPGDLKALFAGLQAEGLIQASRTEDPRAKYDGVIVKQQIRIADTGDVATLSIDAGRALRDLDDRAETFRRLMNCLK